MAKKPFALAIIGLDTSHAIEFPRLLQGDAPKMVDGLRAVTCLRFPSPFQTEEQQDGRQKTLEGWGVRVTRDFADAVAGVDGIMLEINDPAQHWTYFRQCADLKLPVFIDKPLAKNLADARKIVRLAEEKGMRTWESSSLRFSPDLAAARAAVGDALLCSVYGAMGIAAAGSSLVWYGCHSFQMLHQIMGNGAVSAQALQTSRGVVTVVEYGEGRRGVVESITGQYHYGGRIQSKEKVVPFQSNAGGLYYYLMLALREFFLTGAIPVPLRDALEVQAIMEAAEKSLASGQAQKVAKTR